MSDPTHKFYIDDSGTKEYGDDPNQYGRGKSRHFVFGGVLISHSENVKLSSEIIRLKLHYFQDENVEIKSNWLRHPKEQREQYLEPYDITDSWLTEFVDAYYQAIINADLQFIASVVDKVHMQEDYDKPWYPPAIAYEYLLQRVELSMRGRGIVTISIDEMTGAPSKGRQYRDNLIKHHDQLKESGSRLFKSIDFQCVKGRLKFIDSAISHLIQVADVMAYNVYRQFTDYGDDWERQGLEVLPTYDYFHA